MKECLNYKKLDKGIIQCQTCSHFCKIKDGNVGICGIRENIGGKLYLLTYGKAIAIHVDPIEKKPFFHFLPGTFAYSFGTLGCNFRCDNCQNYDISQMLGYKGKVNEYQKFDWGDDMAPEEIVEEAIKCNCRSIAYTYNEPTIFVEYALDTMKKAREKGLKNVWVSNGYMTRETLDAILPWLDAINVDIKSYDDGFYQSNCGAHVKPVLDNCKYLVEKGVWLEITTLIIPTLSDDENMLKKIAQFIKTELGDFIPWHVSAFSGAVSWKLQHLDDTPDDTIRKAHDIGHKEGLKYVYAGNIWDSELESTKCSNCGNNFIDRIAYEVSSCNRSGKCRECGKKIEGVFI
jgi:pyruvate formate lyase activating enzyme